MTRASELPPSSPPSLPPAAPLRPSAALLTMAAIVVVVAGLRAAQPLLVPVVVALFLAVLSATPVAWMRRRGVPRPIALLLVLVANVAILFGVGALVVTAANQFAPVAPLYQQRFEEALAALLSRFEPHAAAPASAPAPATRELARLVGPGAAVGVLLDLLARIAGLLSDLVLVILTTAFMLGEASGLRRKLFLAFGHPEEHLERFACVVRDVHRYLVVKTGISAATGLAVGLWVDWLGVDFALLWGLLAFFLNFIPSLGSIVAAVPPILLAWLQHGFGAAAMVTLGYVAVNMVFGNVLDPLLTGRRVGLSTLVVFLSVLLWGWIWGPVGMLLAVPLTMVVKIWCENSDTPSLRSLAVLLEPPAREK